MSDGDLVVECECGERWMLDYEPPPELCNGTAWRLGVVSIDWGVWTDRDGNQVEI